jgi:hypothetical protein
MEPEFQEQSEQLDTVLRNRGLFPGSEAYDRELQKLRMSQGDQRADARSRALQVAGQEGSRMFQQDLASDQYSTQLRQQDIAEELQRRGFSLNEINALITGQQVAMPTMPGFNTAQAAQPTNYLGAAGMQGQAALDAFNAQNALTGSIIQGITSPFRFNFGG